MDGRTGYEGDEEQRKHETRLEEEERVGTGDGEE